MVRNTQLDDGFPAIQARLKLCRVFGEKPTQNISEGAFLEGLGTGTGKNKQLNTP